MTGEKEYIIWTLNGLFPTEENQKILKIKYLKNKNDYRAGRKRRQMC